MSSEELINPKQAQIMENVKKDADDKRKIRVASEKILKNGNKKIKKIIYEKNVNGKWVKWNTKNIYLGNKKIKGEK